MTDLDREMWHLRELLAERDRRYAEVQAERERALQIKDAADSEALKLSREAQTYKDFKANELREQLGAERNTYATKEDLGRQTREIMATIKPLSDYVSANTGKGVGLNAAWSYLITGVSVVAAVVAIVVGTR